MVNRLCKWVSESFRSYRVKFFVRLLFSILLSLFFMQAANATTTHHSQKHTRTARHKSSHNSVKHSRINKKNRKLAKKVRIMIPNRQPANEDMLVQKSDINSKPSTSFVASIEERLTNFVHKTVGTLRYSIYKLGGSHFDTSRGVYVVDCSSYVDNILKTIYPNAFSSLVNWSGSEKPTTHDYYNFFNELESGRKTFWNKIDDVEELRPGDILVFRYTNARGNETGGHMMIVMNKPVVEDDAYLVRVADSAATGHTEDTRKQSASGIGIGTIVLKVDPKTYQPTAFAWRVGSRLNKNVNVAMARPIDIDQPITAQQSAPTRSPTGIASLFQSIFKS